MSGTQAQVAFVAEFVLFLAALAGIAVLVLRPTLLVPGRAARVAMTTGLAALGVAAFLHGSLLVAEADHPAVFGTRLAGCVLVAGAAARGPRRPLATAALLVAVAGLVAAELAVLLGDEPGLPTDVVRMAGAALLTAAVLYVSRHSIPARVAAGAAGTVLLVVVAVSVTTSSVVVDNVEDEVLRRTRVQASAQAADATFEVPGEVEPRAAAVAELMVEKARSDQPARELMVALGTDPASAAGRQAGAELAESLVNLGEQPHIVPPGGFIVFVTPGGDVVPGAGAPEDGSERAQLGFLVVVQDALDAAALRSAPEVVGSRLLAVAAAPVTLATADGPRFVGVVAVAEPLDDGYLEGAARSDNDLSLTIVGEGGVLARNGPQPPSEVLREAFEDATRDLDVSSRTIGDRFVAAAPVKQGERPIAAMVVTAPSFLAEETRESLFRTLFIVALLATLVAILLAALIGNRIGRGLRRLTMTAEQIQAGNLDVQSGLDQRDELGLLGTAFDRMAGSLRTMTGELREAAVDEARLRGRLEAVVGGMGEALLAVDDDGRISDFNKAAEDLFGRRALDVRGTPVTGLSLAGPEGEDLTVRLASHEGSAWASEGSVLRADGTAVPVALSAAALLGAAGEVAGTVAVVRDMRREREVDRMKTEFLSNISHEMKTPLTPIKGYAQMLATRDLPPERARDFAQEIVAGARQLERVITQLVNFATMAAGRLEPRPEAVRPRAVLDEVVERWSDRVGNGHVLERRVARGTPDLLVDRRLLDLSLDELIDNAVKYSPDGGRVTLTASPAPEGGGVLLSVADRGVGVAEDRLATIFTDFTQGDGSSTREFGGLGLGLPMVRHVARAHGGELRCESTVGRGATFVLRLPAALEPA